MKITDSVRILFIVPMAIFSGSAHPMPIIAWSSVMVKVTAAINAKINFANMTSASSLTCKS